MIAICTKYPDTKIPRAAAPAPAGLIIGWLNDLNSKIFTDRVYPGVFYKHICRVLIN